MANGQPSPIIQDGDNRLEVAAIDSVAAYQPGTGDTEIFVDFDVEVFARHSFVLSDTSADAGPDEAEMNIGGYDEPELGLIIGALRIVRS